MEAYNGIGLQEATGYLLLGLVLVRTMPEMGVEYWQGRMATYSDSLDMKIKGAFLVHHSYGWILAVHEGSWDKWYRFGFGSICLHEGVWMWAHSRRVYSISNKLLIQVLMFILPSHRIKRAIHQPYQ